MCDPVSITLAASTALTAVGKGVGAAQSAATYNYQAKIASRNAQLDAEQGQMVRENQQTQQRQVYRKYAQVEGQQIAAMAANGIDTSFGSAVDVQADTQTALGEDLTQLYRQGYSDLRSTDIQSYNDRARAQGARQAASGAITAGIFDVGETILGGAQQYSKYKAGIK